MMTDTNVKLDNSSHGEVGRHTESTAVKKAKISKRRGIFLSYCTLGDFFEIKFTIELATHLQENGFEKDLWFDFSQIPSDNFDTPIGYAARFEALEKCKAVIIVLSQAYTLCQWCLATFRTVLLKKGKQPAFRIFIIKFSPISSNEAFSALLEDESTCYIDLTVATRSKLSTSEKVVSVLRAFLEYLEIYSSGISCQESENDVVAMSDFRSKSMRNWNIRDVTDWLQSLGVHEKSIMHFEETEVSGRLLPYLTDSVLQELFAIESKVCQRRIKNSIEHFQRKEQETKIRWVKFAQQRGKPLTIYLIFDPSDKNLAHLLRTDLKKKGFKVLLHSALGQTREDFLLLNGSEIARAEVSIVLLTKGASTSPFVYNEAIMSMWLDRRIISLLFQSSLDALKTGLRGILSGYSGINFNALYTDALEILAHELRRGRSSRGIIYELSFLRLLSSSIKPLEDIAQSNVVTDVFNPQKQKYVFFSYHWDNQSQVRILISYMVEQGIPCLSDMAFVTNSLNSSAHETILPSGQIDQHKSLDSEIEHTIRNAAVVVLCASRKYFQCHKRIKEVFLAEEASKPMVPVMMEWMHWPPVNISVDVRKMLVILDHYDLSTDRTLQRNFPFLISKLKNTLSIHAAEIR